MSDKGQMIILTGFLMAVGLAIVVILANNILLSLNSPAVMKPQEGVRVSDVIEVFNKEIKNALRYFETEGIDEATASAKLRSELVNLSRFLEYTYAQHGIALSIEINTSATEIKRVYVANTTKGSIVYLTSHEFPAGSLIIPVDDNQWFLADSDTSNDAYSARIFGLIYRTLNDRNENATPLDDYLIPVYRVLEDPRGPDRDALNDPYGIPYSISVNGLKIVDGENASISSSGMARTIQLKGGPFFISADDLNATTRQAILEEARKLNLDVYELAENFTYNWTVYILGAPVLGVYPEEQTNVQIIIDYFYDAGLSDKEFVLLNTTEIEKGGLDRIDVLFTPHTDISQAYDPSKNLTDTAAWKILKWVENGGVYHVECYGVETVDSTIEKADGNLHPWYGFMGVVGDPNDYGNKYNATILDTIFTNNATLFISQTYTTSGELPPRGGHTPSFYFVNEHNPQAIPLANTTVGDAIVLAYAPFGNGHVIYMGGHRQNEDDRKVPTPSRLNLVFDAFMLARAMKLVPVYEAHVYGTIKYSDGNTEYVKLLNITIQSEQTAPSTELPFQFSFNGSSNIFLNFVQPQNGYVITGTYPVKISSNATSVALYLSNTYLGSMNYNTSSGLFEYMLDTTAFSPGQYILKAIGSKGSDSVSASVSVYIKRNNSTGSSVGTGANWEGELKIKVEDDGDRIEIKFRVWEDRNRNDPLENADVSIVLRDENGLAVFNQTITGKTNENGKFEGNIVRDDDSAIWYLKEGSGESGVVLGTWNFEKNRKYEVEVTVSYGGQVQYFTKEFKYKD